MGKVDESKIAHIINTLEQLEFGSVVITVHDGQITQVDATEKKRFTLSNSRTPFTKNK